MNIQDWMSDTNWKDKLKELYVVYEGAICLYAFSFENQKVLKNYDFIEILKDHGIIANRFTCINSFLSEIITIEELLQRINYKNLKIIYERISNVMFFLIITDYSSVLRFNLKTFSNEFYNYFFKILENWTGDVRNFKSSAALIKKIFELDK